MKARPEIGEQLLHRRPRPHAACVLGDQRDVAEFEDRLPSRLVRRHPSIDVVLGLAIEMILDVLVEAVERSSAADHVSLLGGGAQNPGDGPGQRVPLAGFDLELLAALGRERIELGAAVVFGDALRRT